MISISGLNGGGSAQNGSQISRRQWNKLRLDLNRIIPSSSLLPGAKKVLSWSTIEAQKTNPAFIKHVIKFLEQLDLIGIKSKESFKTFPLEGLAEPPADQAPTATASHARYFLELLGCKFAYLDEQLVIGTKEEIEAGVEARVYAWEPSLENADSMSAVQDTPSPAASPAKPSSPGPIVIRPFSVALSQKEAQQNNEMKETIVFLLGVGEVELAAIKLFASPEELTRNLSLLGEIVEEEDVFSFYDPIDISVAAECADKLDSNVTKNKLLAYLLGRLSVQVSYSSGAALRSLALSRWGSIKNMDQLMEILGFMERSEYRANVIQDLIRLNETSLVNQIFKEARDPGYQAAFESALVRLSARDSESFFTPQEFFDGNKKTIFRKKPVCGKIEFISHLSDSTALVPYDPARERKVFDNQKLLGEIFKWLERQQITNLDFPLNMPCLTNWGEKMSPYLFFASVLYARPKDFQKLFVQEKEKTLASFLKKMEQSNLFRNLSIIEIGGRFADRLKTLGAKVNSFDACFGKDKNGGVLTLDSWEKILFPGQIPERARIIFGNYFFEKGSGIEITLLGNQQCHGLGEENKYLEFPCYEGLLGGNYRELRDEIKNGAAIEVMAICANLAKRGGHILFNNLSSEMLDVPDDFLSFLGVKKECEVKIDDPLYKFGKISIKVCAYHKYEPTFYQDRMKFIYRKPIFGLDGNGIWLKVFERTIFYNQQGFLEAKEKELPLPFIDNSPAPGKVSFHAYLPEIARQAWDREAEDDYF